MLFLFKINAMTEDYKKDTVIAKFMGAAIVSENTMNPMIRKWECKDLPFLNGKFINGHELKFGQDLYWILPVIRKIDYYEFINTPIKEIRDKCYEAIIALK